MKTAPAIDFPRRDSWIAAGAFWIREAVPHRPPRKTNPGGWLTARIHGSMAACQVIRLSARNSLGESSTTRKAVREYFKRYPKEQFQTELETWRYLPSQTIEFTMKRLREPIKKATE
jgi:hypothetical protein